MTLRKISLATSLLITSLLAAPLSVQAQPISGVYVGVGAGVNFVQDERARFTGVAGSGVAGSGIGLDAARLRFDPGFRALGSVGYGLGNGLRVEIEGDYFRNTLSRARLPGLGTAPNRFAGSSVRGTEEKYGGFVNALFDLDPNLLGFDALPFAITPYIGAGVGYLQSRNQNLRIASPGQVLVSGSGSDGNFAYQGIVGLAFPIVAVPGLAFTAEYRFTGVAANRVSQVQSFAPGIVGRARLAERDNLNHSVVALAVRYAFNTPPPASPVPVSPPTSVQAARTYLVFFDWDRVDLTERARQIIAEAATAATRATTTRIEVGGNADRSGTLGYNQGLALRRARAVAGELVRRGVPQAEIAVQGYGDSRPLVSTQAGVREPQNRRVEIILR